jgi:hypothetical protein
MDISEGAGAGEEEEEDEFEMMDDGFDFGDEALGKSVFFGIGPSCFPLLIRTC